MDPTSNLLPAARTWERSGKILGRGEHGTVNLGFLNDVDGRCSRTPVAVKSAKGRGAVQLRREKAFLDVLHGCPQIIGCYGEATSISEEELEEGWGPTYNIFLEFAPQGSLRDRLRLGPMHELVARRLTRSMLQGLVHIHRHDVAHCDLKPDNVMLWGEGEAKIVDFGLALRSCETNVGFSHRGTPYYLAPERIAKNEHRAPADVWALGCTLAEMLTGKPATAYLDDVGYDEFLVLVGKGRAPPEIPEVMSDMGKDFLSRCFEVETRKRWSAEMLLRHPYTAELDHDGDTESELLSSWSSPSSTSASWRATKVVRYLVELVCPAPCRTRHVISPSISSSVRIH